MTVRVHCVVLIRSLNVHSLLLLLLVLVMWMMALSGIHLWVTIVRRDNFFRFTIFYWKIVVVVTCLDYVCILKELCAVHYLRS